MYGIASSIFNIIYTNDFLTEKLHRAFVKSILLGQTLNLMSFSLSHFIKETLTFLKIILVF